MRPHAIHTLKRRATVFAAASAVATLVAACGLGPGKTPGGASLLITQNFGAQTIAQSAKPKIVGADTVMRVLERNANVTTRYGGGFVESIDGHSGGSENGQPADWFYYVNGVQGGKGAAATKVHSGDQIWWDRHIWTATESIPAVVGAFPEPFLDGYGGTRYPTRIECTQTKAKACTAVYNTLAGYGLPVGLGCLDCAEYNMSLRVLVVLDARRRRDSRPPADRAIGRRDLRALHRRRAKARAARPAGPRGKDARCRGGARRRDASARRSAGLVRHGNERRWRRRG